MPGLRIDLKRIRSSSRADSSADISHFKKVRIDEIKIDHYRKGLDLAIENYSLFQKFSFFHWPVWMQNSPASGSLVYNPLPPPLLLNNSIREGISFTNLLSSSELFIDPSGMLSPSYDRWSAEIWVALGGEIIRAADSLQSVTIRRDPGNSTVTMLWTGDLFSITQTVVGARTEIDEAVLEVSSSFAAKAKDACILFVLRPYNNAFLGTLSSVKYGDGSLVVNDMKRIIALDRPDFVLTGNGTQGDIDITGDRERTEIQCDSGMATLCLGYRVKKGAGLCAFRISLDSSREIKPGKINVASIKKEFADFVQLRNRQGCTVSLNDATLKNWFFGTKQSLLNITREDISSSVNTEKGRDLRSLFYLSLGVTRMGHLDESAELADMALEEISGYSNKSLTFGRVTNICYAIALFADVYLHKREMEYLQKNHALLRKAAGLLYDYSARIRDRALIEANSLEYNFTGEGHSYDVILLANALNRFAYLSRSMGIFGDETKFEKEADRVAALFLADAVLSDDNQRFRDDFYCYNAGAFFPFTLAAMNHDRTRQLLANMLSFYRDVPIMVKSMGLDLQATLLVLNCMIYLKDPGVRRAISRVMEIGGERLCLPDYVNPLTGHGCWGRGSSKTADSLFFCTLRNLLFLDIHDRLELFPAPMEEWFMPGSEIIINKAPSRFGNICIRVVTTANEVHVQFEELPKYVPPDILINLPFRVKIVKDDDFVIKKESVSSYLINGWPALVRFIKK